jgi:peroxiredoxin (alkyl hydroperoxide reductase subunit C)
MPRIGDKANCKLVGLSVDGPYSHIAWLRTIKEKIEDITKAVRAVFFIDPKGIIRTIIYYLLSLGRNFDELYRVVLALQTADAFSVATPADWRPGDDVIVPTAGSCGVAKERMENKKDMTCCDWFFCTKKLDKDTVLKTILKK